MISIMFEGGVELIIDDIEIDPVWKELKYDYSIAYMCIGKNIIKMDKVLWIKEVK